MKNYLKIIPVVAGLALATIGSVDEAKASNSSVDAAFFGGCEGSGACGITSEGTRLIGKWKEGDSDSDDALN